jgi:hypothetical protein
MQAAVWQLRKIVVNEEKLAAHGNEKDSDSDLIDSNWEHVSLMTWACHETACTFCHAVMLSLMLGN